MPRGVPWSLFTGERDFPGPGEPWFKAEDRDLALAWQQRQHAVHDACGQLLEQATGEDNDGAWIAEERTCHPCAAIASARRAIHERAGGDPSYTDGLMLVPVYRPELRPQLGG